MGRDGTVDHAAQQHDDLADHEFGDAARVGKRRVEHRNANRARGVDVDLIDANAETANRDQPVGGGEHLGGQLRARTDAENVNAGQRLAQGRALQRLRQAGEIDVARRMEQRHGAIVDVFEQQDLDAILWNGKTRTHDGS